MAFPVAARGTVGEWLSLVEHLVRDQGVGGSNPLSPTNCFSNTCQISRVYFARNTVFSQRQRFQGLHSDSRSHISFYIQSIFDLLH
jgi:hypothetical protein